MTAYKLETITSRISRGPQSGSKRSRYPFESMTAGQGFTIPAEQKQDHHHCRVAASNYNKRNGTKIRCNLLQDGSLRVWIDGGPREPQQAPAEPTNAQFRQYISGMIPGTSIFIPVEFKPRYPEFIGWLAALVVEGLNISSGLDGERLKITKGQ